MSPTRKVGAAVAAPIALIAFTLSLDASPSHEEALGRFRASGVDR
jgi:hypothetical protein